MSHNTFIHICGGKLNKNRCWSPFTFKLFIQVVYFPQHILGVENMCTHFEGCERNVDLHLYALYICTHVDNNGLP